MTGRSNFSADPPERDAASRVGRPARATIYARVDAAARGRLKAIRGDDGRWRSSRAWVGDYVESRHRRG